MQFTYSSGPGVGNTAAQNTAIATYSAVGFPTQAGQSGHFCMNKEHLDEHIFGTENKGCDGEKCTFEHELTGITVVGFCDSAVRNALKAVGVAILALSATY